MCYQSSENSGMSLVQELNYAHRIHLDCGKCGNVPMGELNANSSLVVLYAIPLQSAIRLSEGGPAIESPPYEQGFATIAPKLGNL